jgi:hypothetical protein
MVRAMIIFAALLVLMAAYVAGQQQPEIMQV